MRFVELRHPATGARYRAPEAAVAHLRTRGWRLKPGRPKGSKNNRPDTRPEPQPAMPDDHEQD